jgi:hypothetical protein
MPIKYTVIKAEGKPDSIWAELGDGRVLSIPMDEANSDYQRYLNPEAEQSTPSVIDEAQAK